jgi:hypothetical protein
VKKRVGDIGRVFFSASIFDRQWERMGLDDEDLRRLENDIAGNPQIGDIVRGTGGLRKMRFAPEGRGKSGGSRVLYIDFVVIERVYLIYAYPKNEKDDISPAERAAFKKIIEQTKKELGG